MQTVITAVGKTSKSLRDIIAKDEKRLAKYQLQLEHHKRQTRSHGWAKITCTDGPGAINIQWIDNSKLLICRIVNKGKTNPGRIAGYFIEYLLTHHRPKIVHLQVSKA